MEHPNNNLRYFPEKAPEVTNIEDLIEIAQRKIHYKNIDSSVLWNILPELTKLQNLVGMENLKKTVFYQIIYYLQNMHKKGGENEYLHTVITGASGTGKTSVAEILGKIYKGMGILSKKGSFTIAKREDFVAPYLGQTAIKTRVLLESCIGGVLFIDEAYALGPGQSDRDSFSKEAIDTLNAFLSEHKDDFCCIIAGYQDDIVNCFFKVNKGLERRFQWVHRISAYSHKEMTLILLKMVKDIQWKITVSQEKLINFIKKNEIYFKNFGGDIETFLTKCKMCHARRVFSLDAHHKFIITEDDIQSAIEILQNNTLNPKDSGKPPEHLYI